MEYKDFDGIIKAAERLNQTSRVAVANAADAHVLGFLFAAKEKGITLPILVGNEKKIKNTLMDSRQNPNDYEIYDSPDGEEAQMAVDLVRDGKADFLMKGMMETSDFLRPIVKKENGLRIGRIMSYVALMSFAGYHKLIICTDGGMVTYPDYEKKKQIVINAVDVLHAIGYEKPKVAVLCCKETVDEEMPETVDAAMLKQASLAGGLGDCAVEGPLSYDICMSPEIAAIKKFKCEHSGNFDVLLFPNIHCCNIFVKSLVIHQKARAATIITGCRVPVIAPSRGSTTEEQILSLALASLAAGKGGCV
ncbi:phosphate acetyltransferase [Oxobacter pfennigii]|uniref:Phosphate acetyltransferase n=1 Tax=Oxobacter pfennigii TaxID=36849 RepID=A0A0P8W881_9CLOT|nr:phosphate acyltransferase [Oxobacter pfennigii]KPU44893.1 phosphate acetyltransferase [Oxobacter pfennigii]